jgi:cell division topological specificity factor
MIDFLKRLFGGAEPSSTTAKDRLRLVLMTDHIALAPDVIEQMKRDLIEVISRYVEVDREKVEVNFEREDKVLAMLANIPITAVNRPKPEEPKTATPAAAATSATPGAPPRRRRRRKVNGKVVVPAPAQASTG